MKRTNCEAFSVDDYKENHVLKKRKVSHDLNNYTSPLHFNDLPDEIIIQIFSYLSIPDLYYNIRLVCKRWKRLSKNYKPWISLAISARTPFSDIKLWLKAAINLKQLTMSYRPGIKKILQQVRLNCKKLQILEIIDTKDFFEKSISLYYFHRLLVKHRNLRVVCLFGTHPKYFFQVLLRNHLNRKIIIRKYNTPLNIKDLLDLLSRLGGQYSATYENFQNTPVLYQIRKWKANTCSRRYLKALRNLIKLATLK